MKIENLKLKQSIKAMMLWEMIMKKPFSLDGSMISLIMLLWCIIEVNNPGVISFEDFGKWIDENPEEFNKLCKWLSDDQQRQAELAPAEPKKSSKKKVTKKKVS